MERQIGGGGMGTIWVALDVRLQRRVALKMMRPDHLRSDSLRQHFEQEARAAARIESPNVVQVFDCGVDEADGQATPYIVMELLTGEDLETRLQRQSRLSLQAVTEIIAQASRALSTAHAAGLVHRDLKPANLYLAKVEGREMVKILDFGIAAFRASDRSITHPSYLMGTPHYMSPEQIQAPRTVDARSDLFSLAVVAYQALTGRLPFEAPSLPDLLLCITQPSFPVQPPSQYVPEIAKTPVGKRIDEFFERALHRDRDRRFQSARELANAFTRAADPQQGAQCVKVLVVDDEPDLQQLVRQSFRQQIRRGAYEFAFASDGHAALEELQRRPDLDLILSDINMPGMDGLTLLGHVVQTNPLIKVVMVSAYGDMRNIRDAMNRGAFDFVTKPIDFKDLEATIEKTALQVQAARRTARWGEENSLLRMFVNSGLVERLFPMLQGGDSLPCEWLDATVAFAVVPIDSWKSRKQTQSTTDDLLGPINAIFDRMLPEVTSRSGVIDKFVSNAAMIVFHSDGHLRRALEAALATRTRLAEAGLSGIGIGIASGDVLFGSVGSRAQRRVEFTAIGDIVNLAMSVGAQAIPGEVLIPSNLQRSLRELCALEPAGLQVQIGDGEPIDVLRVQGWRTDMMGTARTESFAVPVGATDVAVKSTTAPAPVEIGQTPTQPGAKAS